jgi:hypothetical protein
MNDSVRDARCLCGCSDGGVTVGPRQLDGSALRFVRMMVDRYRRERYLENQIDRYVREHGHVPTYGQLEELLSFEVDGEPTHLFSRSTIRWAILRWKERRAEQVCRATQNDRQGY